MAVAKYSPTATCGCGAPLKVFPSSGRIAKACSQRCLKALREAKSVGSCVECGAPRGRQALRCKPCAAKLRAKSRANIGTPKPSKVYSCADCGASITRTATYCKPCRAQRQIQDHKRCVCTGCGKSYINTRRSGNEGYKYCSRECYFQYRRDNPSPTYARKRYSPLHDNVCRQCGKEWLGRKRTVLCSDECRRADTNVQSRKHSEGKHVTRTVSCKYCERQFVKAYGTKRREFCSKKCSLAHSRSISKAKRRAKERGIHAESINPYVVFAEACWTCELCGIPTPREHRGTHRPDAPELDHVIPLAAGGTHTWNNVQLLCRSCNQEKSDMVPEGAALRLSPTSPSYSLFDEDTNTVSEQELLEARRRNAQRLAAARELRKG